jgi:uncharacterized protein (TIGR02246 family)
MRDAIETLLYRYARALDELDLDAVTALFTVDGELVTGAGTARGRDEIRAYYAGVRQGHVEQRQRLRHVTTNVLIEAPAPSEAAVHSFFTVVVTEPGGVSIRWAGTYTDLVVDEGDAWRFRRRRIEVDTPD